MTSQIEAFSLNHLKFTNTINGKARSSAKVHQGIDPSTLQPLWDVPVATKSDLDEAASAATSSFRAWSRQPWEKRQEVLTSMSKTLADNKTEMANILSLECGKPKQFAEMEVLHTVQMLDFHAKTKAIPETIVQDDEVLRLSVKYEPIGVVGAISPWNFPLVLSVAKIAAGLLTGNCVIVKPSPFTPYSVLKFTELVQPVLPPGVLQALNGGDDLGPLIVAHPEIQKISFTGSTATGKKIMESASKHLKRITLELGGNDASIVWKDVDIAKVAPQVAVGAFFNSGQLCVASKRIYIHEEIYNEFLSTMLNVVKSWKVGAPSEDGVMLGPVQNKPQYEIVKGFVEDSLKKNYKFAIGGAVEPSQGLFIQPTIIENPPEDSIVVTEEAFGPIVPVLRWKDEDDLVARVNNTKSGLGGSIWSADIDYAYRLADRIETGTVWINSFGKPLAQGFFSGRKESGFGGEQGTQGLLSYCYAKTIHLYKDEV